MMTCWICYSYFSILSIISVISLCNIGGSKVNSLSLLIWTTTPWSLVANKAICFKEDAEYSIVDTGNAGCRLYAACCVVAQRKTGISRTP